MARKLAPANEIFKISTKLANLARTIDLTPKAVEFVEDFARMLKFCMASKEISLLPITSYFPGEIVHALNQLLHDPEMEVDKITQLRTRFVHFFYCTAISAGMLAIAHGRKLLPCDRSSAFLDLAPKHQYVIILDGLWNKLNWVALYARASGWPRDVQKGRNFTAYFLGMVKANVNITLKSFTTGSLAEFTDLSDTTMDKLEDAGMHLKDGVFAERVMPMLQRMDLIDFGLDEGSRRRYKSSIPLPSWFKVTLLGKKVFRTLGNLQPPRSPRHIVGGW